MKSYDKFAGVYLIFGLLFLLTIRGISCIEVTPSSSTTLTSTEAKSEEITKESAAKRAIEDRSTPLSKTSDFWSRRAQNNEPYRGNVPKVTEEQENDNTTEQPLFPKKIRTLTSSGMIHHLNSAFSFSYFFN